MKANEFIHKFKYLFSWRWDTRRDWALIDCVQNDVSRALTLNGEHFFEAFYHCPIIGFVYSTIVCRIELGEYVTGGIGSSRKLDKEGRKQIVEFLFIDIPEVEIIICHRGTSSIA